MVEAKVILATYLLIALGAAAPTIQDGINTDSRIIGGLPAPPKAYPYQISLRHDGKHLCGGSIINENWILTAAHCVGGVSAKSLTAVAGSNNLSKDGATYNVTKIIPHDQFDAWTVANDIALVKVSPTIHFNDAVKPVSLETEDVGGNIKCVLSGWGSTSIGSSSPDALQHVMLATIDTNECQSRHSKTPRPIDERQICTYTKKGEGACHMDSGGPLVANGRQIGIVSWGRPCAVGYPDVFTKVSAFISWIKRYVK